MPITFIEPAKELEPVTLVTHEFTRQDYEDFVFPLEPGEVFYYDTRYIQLNDVLASIERYKAQHLVPAGYVFIFDVRPAVPGDILYIVHGHASIMVMKNESVNTVGPGGPGGGGDVIA